MSAEKRSQAKFKPIAALQANEAITLTIIIASYNTRDLLFSCLLSIHENPPTDPCEIIVVDDASRDGSSAMVRESFPDVRLLVNETNQHYAYSNNRAFDIARGEFVLLLNSDTLMMPKALDLMVEFLRARPDVGVVGCKLLNEDDTIQWSVKSLPNAGAALFGARSVVARLFPNNPFTRKHLLHIGLDMKQPFEVTDGYVSSAAFTVPLKVIKEIGHLDRRFAYHVDADYCKRILDAGYKCYYLPEAVIKHLNHKGGTMASLRVRFRSLRMFETQSYLYYCKHVEKNWSLMRIVVALGLFAHFIALASAQVVREVAGGAKALRVGR